MNTLILIVALILVILLTRREPFTEIFGMSGYKKPIGDIMFDDPVFDKDGYTEIETKVDSDTMEQLVLLTNSEVSKRLGICTYIIETIALKHYKIKEDAENMEKLIQYSKEIAERLNILHMTGDINKIQETKNEILRVSKRYNELNNVNDVYECMFMVVKDSGFSYGFSVVSTVQIKNGVARVIAIRSQPLDTQIPSKISPYKESVGGQEFLNYDVVDELTKIKRSEFEISKNKFI
jgi:hypothetical protein